MVDGDLDAVEAIQRSSPEAAQWKSADYLNYQSWVAKFDNQIAGFLVVRQIAPDEAEVLNLPYPPWSAVTVSPGPFSPHSPTIRQKFTSKCANRT